MGWIWSWKRETRGRPKKKVEEVIIQKKRWRPKKLGRPKWSTNKTIKAEKPTPVKAEELTMEKAQQIVENVNNALSERLSDEKKAQINKLREQVYTVQRDYSITTTKLQPHQQEVMEAAIDTMSVYFNHSVIRWHRYKYVIMQAWNGAWKSFTLYYLTARYAIWKNAKDYWLPYIWEKKNIFIVTQSWSNVRDYVEKYLLWDFSPTRIPPDLIEKITRWSDHIKEIKLKNGCVITIKTVEQWQKRLVWWNPDLLVIDEPVDKDDVWDELLARLRSPKAQLLYWFTPINWYNKSYYFLYEQRDDETRKRTFIGKYASTENKTQDHSALKSFSDEEQKIRMYGEFSPKAGLVYSSFRRENNIIPAMKVSELGECRFYAGLDVWVRHPTGFVAIAVDAGGRHIVFEEMKKSNMLIKDLAQYIKDVQKKHKIKFEKIVIDSAGQRERLELKQYGIQTENARKQQKWANWENNRRAWILRVNQLFNDCNLIIFDNCVDLIKEITTHSYKDSESAKDGEVNKINDDVIDALRYVLFYLKPPKSEKWLEAWFNRKFNALWIRMKNGKLRMNEDYD